MSDITRIIIGRAERVGQSWAETHDNNPNVRIYRDRFRAAWVGIETYDVEYYDSPSCLHHGTSGEHPGALCVDDAIVFLNGTTWDVDVPDGDWPDYDVHCAHCGDLIHAGTE